MPSPCQSRPAHINMNMRATCSKHPRTDEGDRGHSPGTRIYLSDIQDLDILFWRCQYFLGQRQCHLYAARAAMTQSTGQAFGIPVLPNPKHENFRTVGAEHELQPR